MRLLSGLLLALLASSILASEPPHDSARVVFLTQDVANAFDHAGATPDLLEPLQDFVREEFPSSYVPLDLPRLLRAGIAPYYIYNKRYCGPIGKELGANLFVMSHLVMLGPTPEGNDFLYDLEAKAYSSVTGREGVILSAHRVVGGDFGALVIGRQPELWRAILAVAEDQPPAGPQHED